MTASVAIVVVSWNTRDLLRNCLASIEPSVAAGHAAVIVVDNASTDGSAAMVRSSFPWVELIACSENLGFGPAVNLGAARSRAPWLGVANADVALSAGALDALLSAGASAPGAAVLAPRLILGDGSTQHSVFPFPTLRFTALFNLGVLARFGLGDRFCLEGHWDPWRLRRVDWAIGAFLLVRREAFDAVGGFDPEQWMYAEDLDLAWRLAARGFSTLYVPAARVSHVGAASTSQAWGPARQERWMQSTYGWMARRRGLFVTRSYAAMSVLGALARWALLAGGAVLGPARGRGAERRAMRNWARLHARALVSPRATLERHR